MEQNNLFHDRYFLERLLGRGNFSEVWLAKDTKTDIQVALKIYAPATGLDDAGLNIFAREFALVVNANHKNLLKPLYYDSYDRKPYLVLPYCKKGSILKMVGKFTEKDVWRLLRDVASGLAYLHNMKPSVIHQDIKPDNIMIGDNGNFMITDFGVSTHIKSTLRKSLSSAFSSAGTLAYMAPERFGKNNTPIMSNDIYSLGATVYEMLAGDTPFGDNGGLIQMKGAEIPELKGNYSEQLKKVIYKCLSTNPWDRPRAEQLEQYANTALKGKSIKFGEEKSVFQTYKRPIIIALLVVIVACVGGGLWMNQKKQQKEKEAQEKRELEIIAYNDSILSEISKLVLKGDSLSNAGDIHDEGFESAYLKAFECYQNAISSGDELLNDANIINEGDIHNKLDYVESKLYSAYTMMQEKARLFADDPEIAGEFYDRASRISNVIDLNKFQTVIND